MATTAMSYARACWQVHLATAADCEDWAAVERDDQLFRQVFCEVAVRARRLMPSLAAATHEALETPNIQLAVQLLHRAVAAEVMQLFCSSSSSSTFGCNMWGEASSAAGAACDARASAHLQLRSLSQLVGHVCMHALHRKVVLCSDERCVAMERAEFRKAFPGSNLPLTRRWMAGSHHKVVAAMRGAKNPAQCIAYSLLDILADRDCREYPWAETLWLDRDILLSLRDRLHADIAAAALMHATIGEINGILPADGIIESQLVRQASFLNWLAHMWGMLCCSLSVHTCARWSTLLPPRRKPVMLQTWAPSWASCFPPSCRKVLLQTATTCSFRWRSASAAGFSSCSPRKRSRRPCSGRGGT